MLLLQLSTCIYTIRHSARWLVYPAHIQVLWFKTNQKIDLERLQAASFEQQQTTTECHNFEASIACTCSQPDVCKIAELDIAHGNWTVDSSKVMLKFPALLASKDQDHS